MKRHLFLLLLFSCLLCRVHAFDNLKFHTLTSKGGLSYDGILDIRQDGKGFIWILLDRNLFRFDGYTYKSYKDNFHHGTETQLAYFGNLAIDSQGNLYTSITHGVYRYDYQTDRFTQVIDSPAQLIHIDKKDRFWTGFQEGYSYREAGGATVTPGFTGNKQSLYTQIVCEDGDNLYFFSYYGKIYRYGPSDTTIDEWANFEKEYKNASLADATIKQGELWILTKKFLLLRIDLQTGKITYRYQYPHFDNANIRCLYVTDDGIPWIGTINGLYLLDPATDEIRLYRNSKDDPFSLPNNSVWTINEDDRKNIWIGTYTGALAYVNRYEEKIFETYHLSENGLNKVPVSGFNEEGDRIWVSTEGGGIDIFDRHTHRFTHLRHQQGQQGLSSDNTKASVSDKEGNVWIATFRGGLNRYDRAKQQFTHFRRQPRDAHSLYSDNLRKIVLEPDSGLWLFYQEHTATISFFSFREHRFSHHTIEGIAESMTYDYIYDAYRDQGDRLWMITSYWLCSLDVKSKVWQKYPIPSQFNPASTLCIDDNGILWIGTFGNELLRFDPEEQSFASFSGILQSDIAEIYSMNQSINRNGDPLIWMGTNNGLYLFNTATHFLALFKESDGTQGDVYYPLATLKDREGFLYFGGTGGFTIVDPRKVRFNPLKPTAIISNFYIDNQSVLNGNRYKGAVNFSPDLSTIRLTHRQQNIGFKLSSDNYLNADKNLFRYRLKHYDERWMQTDASNRTVFYSKIPPGRYEFELQTANNDGLWGDISSVQIIRKRTPWLSIPVLLLYLLLLGFLLYYIITTYKTRKELELQLYLDQVEKEKNEEIYQNQLQFFTNISHDLKTPLSLIMITINKMREEGMREYYYRILNNNSERLLRLLNDILDFRKIRNNRMQLQIANTDLGEFIQTIADDFREYARRKEINYQIVTNDEILSKVPFDRQVMEKIIMNLLINSFKYTRKGDSISIMGGIKEFRSKYANAHTIADENLAGRETFSIIVSDSGVGISKKSISKVFDRYYRVESKEQHNHLGTGIGLALVKNLVLLHRGSITIYSERNVGTDFVIEFSSSPDYYLPGEWQREASATDSARVDPEAATRDDSEAAAGMDPEAATRDDPARNFQTMLANALTDGKEFHEKTILLAEDNTDLRTIIRDSLGEKYTVIGFGDGKPALEYLEENDADLIISDIMMPEMDGITFCKVIKNNIATSHIPFIMLTAKSGVESMLEGTESGADLYFEKPIDLTLLKTAIFNVFKQQEVLREYYAKNYFAETSNVSANKKDNLFLTEISQIIDEHLDQSDLDVNTIATRMMMSRSKLYAKIKTLTGKSVVEFILSYRLRRAAKLLLESDINIQQAMYAVGIESRSYFTKAFKKEFNMLPSQFILKNKETPGSDPE